MHVCLNRKRSVLLLGPLLCTGCQACAQALKQDQSPDGTCGDTRVGLDPHDDCKETVAASCGTNGSCDGQGKCALYAKGTLCDRATCVSNGAGGLRTERIVCLKAGGVEALDQFPMELHW